MKSSNVCEFLSHAELSRVPVNMGDILRTSCNTVKIQCLLIAPIFVFFLYRTHKVTGMTMEVEIKQDLYGTYSYELLYLF
jgi:hypothetical protein